MRWSLVRHLLAQQGRPGPAAGLFARHHRIPGHTLCHMEGTRHAVTSADGVRIGQLTAGSGPALLLVHGGMGTISSWQRVWGALAGHRRVTAMDRRGRGSSGDAGHV